MSIKYICENKKAVHLSMNRIIAGAEGRTRTGTSVNPLDFESSASANSATSAFLVVPFDLLSLGTIVIIQIW